MKIVLMRHGDAVDADGSITDGERWLTTKGRRLSRDAADTVRDRCSPKTLWTSPLVRAAQTAEIVAGVCGMGGGVSVVREIATGQVASLYERLRTFEGETPVLLVGHEPTLSELAVKLLDDTSWPGFEKSSVCCLTWNRVDVARFDWMYFPKRARLVESRDTLTR